MQPITSLTKEPQNKSQYTAEFDNFYSRFARPYDFLVKLFPPWRNWLSHALLCLKGPRVLEVSFGTGYLLTQFANRYRAFGIDYNLIMAKTATQNLRQHRLSAQLQQADVCHLPYANDSFDTIVNTMAFTGYPDGDSALTEMKRILKREGRLILIDVYFPHNRNWLGTSLAKFWMASGDILRDMGALFQSKGMAYTEQEIGGFGSIHLYLAEKS